MTRFSAPVTLPDLSVEESTQSGDGYRVVAYNNETNTYDEVIAVLMLATGCTMEEAYIETWEIDHYGQCAVHRADEEECQRVAKTISRIGVVTEVEPDSF